MFDKKIFYGLNRRSIRLKGYDYSKTGLYFITICCQNGEHLFGEITEGQMSLNEAGKMVDRIWNEIPKDFVNRLLHEYVIMPNHFYGIIEIERVGAESISALNRETLKRVTTEKENASRHPSSTLLRLRLHSKTPTWSPSRWQFRKQKI